MDSHRHRHTRRVAAVILITTVYGLMGRLAGAQTGDLAAAALRGDLPTVDALLKSRADVSNRSAPDLTLALIESSERGHLDVVQALLAAHADPNARMPGSGATPLIQALLGGHWDVAQALLKAGANANAATAWGRP